MPKLDRHSDNHQVIDPSLLMELAKILLSLSLIAASLVN
jgi:hypothetical protein